MTGLLRQLTMVIAISMGLSTSIRADWPIISEFLCNPSGTATAEWIELYNPTGSSLDLKRYIIGDEGDLRQITPSTKMLRPGEFVILTDNAEAFALEYPEANCDVIDVAGWRALNNTGDLIRLGDAGGHILDSVSYASGFENNRSWEVYTDGDHSVWGESYAVLGSTPCAENSYYPVISNKISLSVTPDPFSPDGDGFEDQCIIRYYPTSGSSFELAIYDVAGYKLKGFFDNRPAVPGEIMWDGHDDAGKRLPVGIYILFAAVDGGSGAKRTIVIAR